MNEKPVYFVFEGIVGCGKSTQSKLFVENSNKLYPNREIVWTREPGGDEVADAIRKVAQGMIFGVEMNAVCEAYLYAASRAQTLRTVVKPVLDRGGIVVSDRSLFTSLTYQAVARGLGVDTILEINKVAVGDMWPTAVFYIDLAVETALSRCSDVDGDKFEKMGTEFFNKCRDGYLQLAIRYPETFLTIDGQGTIEEVSQRIDEACKKYLN